MNVAVCIVGWYLNIETFKRIRELKNVSNFFIVSHKLIPEKLKNNLKALDFEIYERENRGWDWGAFQQWLDLNLWQQFDYCFFMHDDLEIKKEAISNCLQLFQKNDINVIGNVRNANGKLDWPKTHPQCYKHSSWKPPSQNFKHYTVRGSFFGIPKKVLEAINGQFEINWSDEHIRIGNHSQIATCGKIAEKVGNQFYYLSNTFESEYIIEYERGKRK